MTKPIPTMAAELARALEDEAGWSGCATAFDAAGRPVGFGNPSAVRMCALLRATRLFGDRAADRLSGAYAQRFAPSSISGDNDARGRLYVRARLLEMAGGERG